MTTHKGVVLIIGAGPNVGASVAAKFSENGYRVALAARSLTDGLSADGNLHIKADLSQPSGVPSIFLKVKKAFGIPNVVVYNGANRLTTPPDDPFAAPIEDFHQTLKVGLDSAYIAAQESLRGFKELPASPSKAFIYTGNALNQIAIPGTLPFGVSKVAGSLFIEHAALAYGEKGYRFYYVDERLPDGRPVGFPVSAGAHADMFWTLANETKQTPWLVTFTKEEGRKPFVGVDFDGNTRESRMKRLSQ